MITAGPAGRNPAPDPPKRYAPRPLPFPQAAQAEEGQGGGALPVETAAPVSAHFGLFINTADWAQRYGSIRASTAAGNMRCTPSGVGAPPSSGWMA